LTRFVYCINVVCSTKY